MALNLSSRLKHGWNAFLNNKDPTIRYGTGYYRRPDRVRLTGGKENSIFNSICNRIALDVASIEIEHVQLDADGRFLSVIDSPLNNCLTLEANIDQTSNAFIQDAVMSMFDEGCVAIFPVVTDVDPEDTSGFRIYSLRTGKIQEWYPQNVRISAYNDLTGRKEDIILPKASTCIVENPLYSIMNEPNSTMQRLIRKLSLLDLTDERTCSGKLDLIIQLPYVVKTQQKRIQAEQRRHDLEEQLAGSQYGVAYADGTERIVQLNRAVENNLMKQVEYLTSMLYSQLGITQSILDGTADEETMLNYYNRTVEPIISAIVKEMRRKFLSKTARTQRKSICFFRDPFKLVSASQMAEIADKYTRNEILTSNEVRQIIGRKPVDDPRADELRNKNLNAPPGNQTSLKDTNDDDENKNLHIG